MAYDYATERPKLFTEDGVRMLRRIEANVRRLLAESGCFYAEAAFKGISGDGWEMLAALDWLIEEKIIRRVETPERRMGQYQIYEAYSRS